MEETVRKQILKDELLKILEKGLKRLKEDREH